MMGMSIISEASFPGLLRCSRKPDFVMLLDVSSLLSKERSPLVRYGGDFVLGHVLAALLTWGLGWLTLIVSGFGAWAGPGGCQMIMKAHLCAVNSSLSWFYWSGLDSYHKQG
jgi:hypothetical protein